MNSGSPYNHKSVKVEKLKFRQLKIQLCIAYRLLYGRRYIFYELKAKTE